jgi:hypothetical protein
MANEIKQEVFFKQIERLLDEWVKDMGGAILQLEETLVELANLELIESPSADDKKKMEKLKKDLAASRQKIEEITLGMKVSMMGITDPIQAEPQDLTKKLPSWVKETIKKKGVRLSKHVTLTPDIGFDVKSKKIKSFGITLKW